MVIIAADENVALQFLQIFPWLPGVEGDSTGLFIGPPDVEGGDSPRRCAWKHGLTEGQEDMWRAVVVAENAGALFEAVDSLDDLVDPWTPATPA